VLEVPDSKSLVTATKSLSLEYTAPNELFFLFETFGRMCNDAMRIAVQGKPKNRLQLIQAAYPRLKEYGLHTHYILSACEAAFSAYRNKRRKSIPHFTRNFVKLDNQSYRLNHFLLRIPVTPRRFVFLTLIGSAYHSALIDNPGLKRGSIVINEKSVNIAFSKKVRIINPAGFIGVDLNERNATVTAADGWTHRFDGLGDVAEIKERYRDIRTSIQRKTRGDRRIGQEVLVKYGKRERDRTSQRIHRITKEIVDYSKEHMLGIKMEKLTGIRILYRRRKSAAKSLRTRMNTWVFSETQRQIDYKARWEGVPTYFVNPRGTSAYCPDCGSRVAPLADRKLYCPTCDKTWDRDVLASKNIMACAVPQARPSKGSCEGERGDDGSNPPSRWREGNSAVNHIRERPEPGRVCSAS